VITGRSLDRLCCRLRLMVLTSARAVGLNSAQPVNQPLTMNDKYEKSVFPGHHVSVGSHAAKRTPLQAFQAASTFQQQGLHDQAEPLYRRVLRQDRNHFGSLYNLGLILLQRGRADEAVSLFRKACYQKPNNPDAHNNLGVALQALKRPEQAVEHHRKAHCRI